MRLPCLAGCVGASVGAALHAQLRSIKVTCNHINYVMTETRFLALANEMEEIKRQSGPGDLYEGAYDLLSSAYQTSDHWVQINTELAAIYGSVYGIIVSFVLCSIVVAILSHNWRIVVSMLFTILGILLALLALFRVFGWRLGIVEAISLSILVGNSLDYHN